MNRNIRLFLRSRWAIFLLVLLLALAGCRGTLTPSPTPTATEAAGLPGTRTPAPAGTKAPAVLTATAASASQTPGPTPTGPTATPGGPTVTPGSPTTQPVAEAGEVSPTPGECQVPAGWVVYTILPGDTLSWLAQVTGSTVEELRAGNCLEGDELVAYETIHLPKRPPEAVAVVPEPIPPSPVDECASIFSCSNPYLPGLILPFANGGAADDCMPELPGAWIDVPAFYSEGDPDEMANLSVPMGQALDFLACGFSQPDRLTVSISGPFWTEKLVVGAEETSLSPGDPYGFNPLNPGFLDGKFRPDQRAFVWYPTCWLEKGSYTITASDGINTAEITLKLEPADAPSIMIKPYMMSPGDGFDIYYCGFHDQAGKRLLVNLLAFRGRAADMIYGEYEVLRSWEVAINHLGSYQQRQFVAPGTPSNEYALLAWDGVTDLPGLDQGYWYELLPTGWFWVMP